MTDVHQQEQDAVMTIKMQSVKSCHYGIWKPSAFGFGVRRLMINVLVKQHASTERIDRRSSALACRRYSFASTMAGSFEFGRQQQHGVLVRSIVDRLINQESRAV
jgi:hypothetical protein